MTITNDAYGNYFIGNKDTTQLLDWNMLLQCMRQALGSNDRAAIFTTNQSGYNNAARIDWRPNIPQETLTGVIAPPLDTYFGGFNQSTSRFSILYNDVDPTYAILKPGSGDTYASSLSVRRINNSLDNVLCWAVANKQSISYFLLKNTTNYYFQSIGVLHNSDYPFPQNCYNFAIASTPEWFSQSGLVAHTLHGDRLITTFGTVANYPHTNNSGASTQSEVELYLRRGTNAFEIPIGYIPNVLKWKVDGQETPVAIGSTVKVNMLNPTPDFPSTGPIFYRVVGRLGNSGNLFDLTGDYVLMRVAS